MPAEGWAPPPSGKIINRAYYILHERIDHAEKTLLKKVEIMCDEVCDEHFQGCSNISKVIFVGPPVLEISKFVEAEDIDLIIMGTYGRSRMDHVIFGSVAENVVKKSPVPV